MNTPIISRFRRHQRISKVLLFLMTWCQLHAYGLQAVLYTNAMPLANDAALGALPAVAKHQNPKHIGPLSGDKKQAFEAFFQANRALPSVSKDSLTYKNLNNNDPLPQNELETAQQTPVNRTPAYMPTSLKDIKLASPSEGVVSMPVAVANQMGTATTSFPIKLPAGRGGMAPKLSINYNSDAGNGWLGLGWELNIPSINIDTRWGVPRYDASTETETYTLAGEQLTFSEGEKGPYLLPHRLEGFGKSRIQNRQFYPRIEGAYDKIVRLGDSPKNYYWKVSTKEGIVNYYGGDETGVKDSAVLRNPDPNNNHISQWALYKSVDTHGNYVKYEYEQVTYKKTGPYGFVQMGDGGIALYIKQIEYGGNNTSPISSGYKIIFNKKDRSDVQVSGRLGFIQTTANLLDEILVKFNDEKVKTYQLTYKEGAFGKSLLSSISEKDALDNEFYTNRLEYFDHTKNNAVVYSPKLIEANPVNDLKTDLSILGSAKSESNNYGYAYGGGAVSKSANIFNFNPSLKSGTYASDYAVNIAKASQRSGLIDLNSDGLPDYANFDEPQIAFRANELQKDKQNFNTEVKKAENYSGEIEKTSSINSTYAYLYTQGNPFTNNRNGIQYGKTRITTDNYFTDTNGDGIADIVKNGVVNFGFIQNGTLSYTKDSKNTPNPIASSVYTPASTKLEFDIKEFNDRNPPHDVVRVWKLPYNTCQCNFWTIENKVKLKTPSSGQFLGTEDGVKVALQLNDKEIIERVTLTPNAPEQSFTINNQEIKPTDHLYFRVIGLENAQNDLVDWDIKITANDFSNNQELSDPNGLKTTEFKIEESKIFTSKIGHGVVSKSSNVSSAQITGKFSKPITTDDVSLFAEVYDQNNVMLRSVPLVDASFNNASFKNASFKYSDEVTDRSIQLDNLAVSKGQVVKLAVKSLSNVAWEKLSFKDLKIKFFDAASPDGNISLDMAPHLKYYNYYGEKKYRANPIPEGFIKDKYFFTPTFNTLTNSQIDSFKNKSFTYRMVVKQKQANNTFTNPQYRDISIEVDALGVVKTKIVNNVNANSIPFEVELNANDKVYCELYTEDPASAQYANEIFHHLIRASTAINVVDPNNANLYLPVKHKSLYWNLYLLDNHQDIFDQNYKMNTLTDARFGSMYRGWGAFAYNPKPNPSSQAIDETALAIDLHTEAQMPIYEKRFFSLFPHPSKNRYEGANPLIYIDGSQMSASRLAVDHIANYMKLAAPEQGVNQAPIKIITSEFEQDYEPPTATGNGVGNAINNTNNAISGNFSQKQTDYIDLNGDAYPDVIANNSNSIAYNDINVNYTNPLGAYMPRLSLWKAYEPISQIYSRVYNATVDGLSVIPAQHAHRASSVQAIGTALIEQHSQQEALAAIRNVTAGANYTTDPNSPTTDNDEYILSDVNGDGLPDRIRSGRVSLNLGYAFAPEQQMNNYVLGAGITAVQNHTQGDTVLGKSLPNDGLALLNGSIAQGGNSVITTSQKTVMNADINADGLLDIVYYSPANASIQVAYNTGNSFTMPVNFEGNYQINKTETKLGAEHKNFTIAPITPLTQNKDQGIKVAMSPNTGSAFGQSDSLTQMIDIDGDGYLDFVSKDAAAINASISTIATTNLLKKVTTPLGGSWEIEYERMGNSYEMPKSKYVLKKVITNDNFTADNAFAPDIKITNILYKNPYYSRRERTFYGFERLEISEIDTKEKAKDATEFYRRTVKIFNNNNYYLKGRLQREWLEDDRALMWTEKTYEYNLYNIHDTNVLNTNLNLLNEEEKFHRDYACFVALKQKRNIFTEGAIRAEGPGNVHARLKQSAIDIVTYDEFGNVKEMIDQGDQQLASDAVTTTSDYTNVLAPNGYLVAPKKIQLTAAGLSRTKSFAYNAQGKLTALNLHNGTVLSTTNYTYDALGNKITETYPVNANGQRLVDTYTYDPVMQIYPIKIENTWGHQTKFKYEYPLGLMTYMEDTNLQPTYYSYDLRGRMVKMVGPYELYNSPTSPDPKLVDVGPWTIKFIYPNTFSANPNQAQHAAKTIRYDEGNATQFSEKDGLKSIVIEDGFGQLIQTKKQALLENNQKLQYVISPKVEKDAFGRALKTYYPTVEDITSAELLYHNTVDVVPPTIQTYDVMDRVLSIQQPKEDLKAKIKYSIAPDPNSRLMFEAIYTDELGNTKKIYTDIKAKNTYTVDASDTGDIQTKFEYSPIRELLKVSNLAGRTYESTYDDLGRRLTYKHPDTGLTTYEYDPLGNLLRKTNAANESIKYEYDHHRITAIKYPNYPENNVNYYYGTPRNTSSMDDNAVGRVWYQTDATGSQYFKYGRLGELVYQRRAMTLPKGGVYWFDTTWDYDTWNRIKQITYPDGEILKYEYNQAGNLSKMFTVKHKDDNYDNAEQKIIGKINYDKFDQKTSMLYGNNSRIDYSYETNRRRLLKLNVQGHKSDDPKLVNYIKNIYQYDVISNMTELHNNVSVKDNPLVLASDYTYTYDDLYRLTSAAANWRQEGKIDEYTDDKITTSPYEKTGKYNMLYTYDNSNNIMSKEQWLERGEGKTTNKQKSTFHDPALSYRMNYRYDDQNHPHAPSRVVEEPNDVPTATCCNPNDPRVKFNNYTYDAKGNTLTLEEESCTAKTMIKRYYWDEENRLRMLDPDPSNALSTRVSLYTYDDKGQRAIKQDISSATYELTVPNQALKDQNIAPITYSATLFPSDLMTMLVTRGRKCPRLRPCTYYTSTSYTKYYMAGSQLIMSKAGSDSNRGKFDCAWQIIPFSADPLPINMALASEETLKKAEEAQALLLKPSHTQAPNYLQNAGYVDQSCVNGHQRNVNSENKSAFWYHTDHLGSVVATSNYKLDDQYMPINPAQANLSYTHLYSPSGEKLLQGYQNYTPYQFNSQYYDDNTQNYYYGARYYNPKLNLWLNPQPMAEHQLGAAHLMDALSVNTVATTMNLNPYIYTYHNPVVYSYPHSRPMHFSHKIHPQAVDTFHAKPAAYHLPWSLKKETNPHPSALYWLMKNPNLFNLNHTNSNTP
jgi:RHS repeat-associated protein